MMGQFLTKRIKGKLYVEASDVASIVNAEIARRATERAPEPDETVLAIMAAARTGDAAELATILREWALEDPVHSLIFSWACPLTRPQALRAAKLLKSIADEQTESISHA